MQTIELEILIRRKIKVVNKKKLGKLNLIMEISKIQSMLPEGTEIRWDDDKLKLL